MQLTTHTDYSLRVLIYLALHEDEGQTTVHDIAQRYGISSNHVAKVAQTLAQLGYVKSQRGRGGGLVLARPVDEIGVGELVRQTENLKLLECFGPDSTCPIAPSCKLKNLLWDAQQAFLKVLDGCTVKDLVTNDQELLSLLGEAGVPFKPIRVV